MKKLAEGENATRSMTVDLGSSTVSVSATVRPDGKTSDRYQMEFILDFTDVTEEEFYQLAARSAVIAYQAQWRKAKEADRLDTAKWERTIDVKAEIIDVERSKADTLTKAKTLVGKMSEAEKTALRALLMN